MPTQHIYGFSTGALALGDFARALEWLRASTAKVVELSALRFDELAPLAAAHGDLDLGAFRHVSVHAPSRFGPGEERAAAEQLRFCIDRGWPIVMHPDAIAEPALWAPFGRLLALENMDKRKPAGRSVDELQPYFDALPEAGFCLDLAHARQVDPTQITTRALLRAYGERLAQVHLSQVDTASRHHPLNWSSIDALARVADLLPPTAIVLESPVAAAEIDTELEFARRALEPDAPLPA